MSVNLEKLILNLALELSAATFPVYETYQKDSHFIFYEISLVPSGRGKRGFVRICLQMSYTCVRGKLRRDGVYGRHRVVCIEEMVVKGIGCRN